jgi:DNA-binding response OmpR family regulator
MPPAAYNLLRYLYQNRHRPCTRSELYYLAHRRLEGEPASWRDEHWEHPGSWGRIIDTTLWRLREKIEPDPSQPVYVVSNTVGDVNCVQLRHTW